MHDLWNNIIATDEVGVHTARVFLNGHFYCGALVTHAIDRKIGCVEKMY